MKNLLLIIDPQNDFVNQKGVMYIKDAQKAINNINKFINANINKIDDIIITQDSHYSFHVSHSNFWKPIPKLFSEISYEQVKSKKFEPIVNSQTKQKELLNYLKKLESLDQKQTIWPDHCILGSWGWAIDNQLVKVLNKWSINNNGKQYQIVQKGSYPWKEMYSVFSYADQSLTKQGKELMNQLKKYDKIYVCGFAKDYCVASSVLDLINNSFAKKLIFLDSCMGLIDKNNSLLKVYDQAIKKGSKYYKKMII